MTCAQIQLWLVVQEELFAFERLVEFVLQQEPLHSSNVHIRLEELKGVLALRFDMVHGGVGILDQRVGITGIQWKHRDPEAGRDHDLVAAQG